MKKIIIACIAFSSLNAFAVCQNTDKIYTAENDDFGTSLKLSYVCEAEGDEICLYTNDEVASVDGSIKNLSISSSELYRRTYSAKGNSIKISLKTGLLESILDYKSVRVDLDKKTLKGTIEVKGKGVDPYSGRSSSSLKSTLTCKGA